ncbi:MAG: MASE3 domain-containing protein [Desulfocapsaceae bacterium]|nr:MASE3 domain-containing protein [Desulfocapsaceae bacterium]
MQRQTDDRNPLRFLCMEITTGSVLCLGLYFASLYNYLLFHSLAEMFSVIIAMAVFIFGWNARRYMANDFLVFLGLAYFFVGAIDMVHTLTYSGMNIFHGYEANLPTQMWLAARYLQALSLLVAPFFLSRKLPVVAAGFALNILVILMFASVFYWKVFPVAYVEGVGLTPFKIVSEYLISMVLLAAAALLYRNRSLLDRQVFRLVIFAIMTTVLSEMAFTQYATPYGTANFVGHLLKIISFWLVYKAIIMAGLQKPYHTIFYALQEKKEALTAAKIHLEARVRERTAELAVTRDRLRHELVEKENLLDQIRESERQIQFVWDTSPMINFTLDTVGNVTAMNRFAVEQLGYQPEELMGRPVIDIFHKEDRPGVLAQFEAIQQYPESIHEMELRNIHKDGHVVWVKEIARQAKDHDDKTVVLIACQDITERKKAEALSRISDGKYQDLYDNAPDMYVSVDAATTLIIDCNQTTAKMLGYGKEEIIGRPIFDMYDPDCRDDVKKAFQAFVKTGRVHDVELQLRRKDGTRIDISLNVSAVRDADGKVLYSRACWTDITDRKKKENEIRQLNLELEQRVEERTAALTNKAEDLSRSQQAL